MKFRRTDDDETSFRVRALHGALEQAMIEYLQSIGDDVPLDVKMGIAAGAAVRLMVSTLDVQAHVLGDEWTHDMKNDFMERFFSVIEGIANESCSRINSKLN